MATLVTEQRNPKVLGLRPIQWIMVAIILVALAGGAYALQGGAMVAYASIPEAREQARNVQVFGYLYSKGEYDEQGSWQFDIQDENGEVMTIVYPHTKPGNFEQAISVVAVGQYDGQTQKFVADQLLVKCPSKYQEQAETRPVVQ
jgi:cytochrome c-type biogenesis protein CcmE